MTKPKTDLTRDVPSSHPSLLSTLNHIWEGEQFWYGVLSAPDSSLDPSRRPAGPEPEALFSRLVRYNVGPNMWDDPAIHFRIVLSDSAAKEETLGKVTQKIIWFFSMSFTPLKTGV